MTGRSFGSLERAAVLTDLHGAFNLLAVAELTRPIGLEAVERAAIAVAKRHPLLGMRAAATGFEPRAGAPAEVLERTRIDDAIDELLNDCARLRGAPMLRVRVAAGDLGSQIALAVPHYAIDAISMLDLLEDIATAVSVPDSIEPAYALPQPVEYRLPSPTPRVRGLAIAFGLLARELGIELRVAMERAGRVRLAKPLAGRSRALLRRLGADETRALMQQCREHEVTINGLLCSLFARLFLHEVLRQTSGSVRVMSMRDLRQRVTPYLPPDQVLFCISMMRRLLYVDRGQIWKIARQASDGFAASGRSGEAFFANRMAPLVVRMAARSKTMRMTDVAVTTPLVRLQRPESRELIRSVYGFVSASPISPPISITAATTADAINIGFSYLDSEFSTARMAEIAGHFVSDIRSVLKDTLQ